MALPKSVETPRGLELQAKLKAAIAADRSLKEWPMPTRDDYVVIGGIIVFFSYVEFNLRRLAEVFDHADLLPLPWKGRAVDLNIGEVARAVQAARVWAGPADVEALKRMARPVCKGFCRDRRLISLLQRIRPRRSATGQDGDARAPGPHKLFGRRAPF